MIGDSEIEAMEEMIQELQKNLSAKRKEAHDSKHKKLREALTARSKADEAVEKELKELGYLMYFKNPWVI
jgi:Skp family chaperone for outer membrane proteins